MTRPADVGKGAGGLAPLHRGGDGVEVDPVAVAVDDRQQRADGGRPEEMGHEAQVEQLGVGGPVVVLLLLHPGVLHVLDAHAPG